MPKPVAPDPHNPSPRLREIYRAYAEDPGRRRSWSAVNRGNVAIRQEVAEAILERAHTAMAAGAEVLDVGCGTGWWLEYLHRNGTDQARLHGVDALEHRVRAARTRAPGATVLDGDATELPWASGRFGLVTLLTVLSSLDSQAAQRRALAEALRVASADGLVAIWEPRWPNPRNPHTRPVGAALKAFDASRASERSITLAPPIARRLGPATPRAYGRLASVPWLRSHRLVFLRPQAASGASSAA